LSFAADLDLPFAVGLSPRRSLESIEFSEGLEHIGRGAFYKCKNLSHINKLPSTLREIGDSAFHDCRNLDSIEFPEGLQVIGNFPYMNCGANHWKVSISLPQFARLALLFFRNAQA
jgi:hypothetical protein